MRLKQLKVVAAQLLFVCLCIQLNNCVCAQNSEDLLSTSLDDEIRDNNNSILDLNEEDETIVASEQQDQFRRRKFIYKDHPNDHGIYSGRSLSSTKNIKNNLDSEDLLDLEEEEGEENKLGNRNIRKEKKNNGANDVDDDDDESLPLKTIDYSEKEWQLMFRAFDLAYDSMTSSILQEISKRTNLFDEIVSRLPLACKRDIYHIKESVQKHRLWALRMLDSNGKIPSGVTYGRFSSPGDYEECLTTRVNELVYRKTKNSSSQMDNNNNSNDFYTEQHKFYGKYCLIDFRLPLPEKPKNKLLSIHESVLNFTGTELERQYPEFVKNYSSYASIFYEVGYMHAFCLPNTCQIEDVTKSIGKTFEGMYLIVNNTVDCEYWPDEPEPLRTSQIVSLLIMAFVFTNAFLASFAYYLLPKNNKEQQKINETTTTNKGKLKWQNYLVSLCARNKFYADCFSIQKNFERLSKPDPRGLTFVHYTRIVAMALTVITHTGALGTLQAITKPADASNSEQIFRDFFPQMLANAFTSIQIFFFMAGFMLVISTYPSICRDKGQMSFLEYAIKRAIRLMPGIAATICLNFIWPLLVEGPMLKYFIRMIVVPCEINWWHTMGFMSNFDHVEKMCLRHSYFSASDYQLHIVAFPLLILLYKQPALSLFLAALITLCGFIAQVIMVLTKNVLPFMMVDYLDKEAFFNVVHYIHHPVWNHMSAFFYGFIIGYLVVKQIRINLSETTIKRIWLILLPIGILSIFAPYYWNHYKRPIERWQMVAYVIIDRFILLSTCAWLSYASMVLARPQRPKSATRKASAVVAGTDASVAADQRQQQQQINVLPAITLAPIIVQTPTMPTLSDTVAINRDTPNLSEHKQQSSLKPSSLPGSSLPRQRSSPNLINDELQQQQQQHQHQQQQQKNNTDDNYNRFNGADLSTLNLRKMLRTTSGSNLATITEQTITTTAAAATKLDNNNLAQVNLVAPQIGPMKPIAQQHIQKKASKNQVPISNMNILCLILSRLTFQLYLFNMVVLWIDVNQSKYYWYFSYYFIIIKAAAVYIASALIAMIFFVVLESPSLTLYIAWVRGRAASRAKIGTVTPTVLVDSSTNKPKTSENK